MVEYCLEDPVDIGHTVVVLVRRSTSTVLAATGECEGSTALLGVYLGRLDRTATTAEVVASSSHGNN